MGTFGNQIKAFTVAAMIAAALVVSAPPAAADQAVTVTRGDGSKVCIILYGVISNTNDHVKSVLGAILEKLGC
jgi:hypothetical protein